jgi:hypothetical protein
MRSGDMRSMRAAQRRSRAGAQAPLADRMRDVFAAGEVMPGTTGIGMGLTVAVTNVRAMGGTLTLTTALAAPTEAGVTIAIRLPFQEDKGHSDSASQSIRRRRGMVSSSVTSN